MLAVAEDPNDGLRILDQDSALGNSAGVLQEILHEVDAGLGYMTSAFGMKDAAPNGAPKGSQVVGKKVDQ